MGEANQWYTHAVGSTNGDWDELKDKFCLAFFPMSRIESLPRAILDFERYEKESIGAAWARFSKLIHAGPDLSLPNDMILHLFCLGIYMEADLCLNMTFAWRCLAMKFSRNSTCSIIVLCVNHPLAVTSRHRSASMSRPKQKRHKITPSGKDKSRPICINVENQAQPTPIDTF